MARLDRFDLCGAVSNLFRLGSAFATERLALKALACDVAATVRIWLQTKSISPVVVLFRAQAHRLCQSTVPTEPPRGHELVHCKLDGLGTVAFERREPLSSEHDLLPIGPVLRWAKDRLEPAQLQA